MENEQNNGIPDEVRDAKRKQQLIAQKRFFKDVLDNIQDGISILDEDLRILFVNTAMKKWYAHKVPLVGKKCYDAYHGRTELCEICPSKRTLTTGMQDFDVVPFTGRNGIKGWLQLFTFPLRDSETDELLGVIEYVRNISELKQAEESLRESEERFRALAQTANDAIITTNRDGMISFWNKSAESIFGYSEAEVIGKPLTFLMPERYRHLHEEILKSIFFFTEPVIRHTGSTHELYGLTKNGSEFPIDLSIAAWDTRKGKFYTVIIRDITKRKHMEEELRALTLIDELTGLYNRRGFLTLARQQLKIADRLQRGLFLIFADMDGLKRINDSYGHHEGNKAIIDTGNILRETFRESDIIARIGGDEFVVMAMETTDTRPEVFNARLQNDVQVFNNRKDRRYALSISIGIACYDPANPCSLDDLLLKADRLMYEQKRNKQKDLTED